MRTALRGYQRGCTLQHVDVSGLPSHRRSGSERRTDCRACGVYCDHVVHPSGCLERGCPDLVIGTALSGRLHATCRLGVFAASIDLEHLESATAEGGFGALKCRKAPLERCPSSIDQAYAHRAEALGCVNPEFFEPFGGDTFRVIARIPIEP
jgi:hypothetical protein